METYSTPNNGIELSEDFIFDNRAIYNRIVKELNKAQNQILVAAAWFTDPDLLDTLVLKAKDGIKVEVIIADNVDNEKLDFTELLLNGGIIRKIKNTGYGMMHQKFCVIDNKVALHGSYNWSVNARKNNDESITISRIPHMIQKMVAHFETIKEKGEPINKKPKSGLLKTISEVFTPKKKSDENGHSEKKNSEIQNIIQSNSEVEKSEFERLLDQMIAAEVSNFDRSLLKKEGYERCKLNNGDHQVLSTALDSVYSVFINQINIVEDKKTRLKTKIKEQETKNINSESEKFDLAQNSIRQEFSSMEQDINVKITNLNTQIEKHNNTIKDIEDNQIPHYQSNIEILKQKIREIQIEFIKPKIKYFELVPIGLILIGVLFYIFLFYSSAAYILIFSTADAELQKSQGINIPPPEIYNSEALKLASDKGISGILIIILFVFIPIGSSIMDKILSSTSKFWRVANKWISILLIIVVDFSIAYKVAESIHKVNYLTGKTDEEWMLKEIIYDSNFYLVFILGALGLIVFKITYNKFVSIFENRDPDLENQKMKLKGLQFQEQIDLQLSGIKSANDKKLEVENEIIILSNELQLLNSYKEFIPSKQEYKLNTCRNEFNLKKLNIENISSIYISHIENDILPISIDSIKDRINIYLEGWLNYLNEQYSIALANLMGQKALIEANNWKQERIENKSIDSRIIK